MHTAYMHLYVSVTRIQLGFKSDNQKLSKNKKHKAACIPVQRLRDCFYLILTQINSLVTFTFAMETIAANKTFNICDTELIAISIFSNCDQVECAYI